MFQLPANLFPPASTGNESLQGLAGLFSTAGLFDGTASEAGDSFSSLLSVAKTSLEICANLPFAAAGTDGAVVDVPVPGFVDRPVAGIDSRPLPEPFGWLTQQAEADSSERGQVALSGARGERLSSDERPTSARQNGQTRTENALDISSWLFRAESRDAGDAVAALSRRPHSEAIPEIENTSPADEEASLPEQVPLAIMSTGLPPSVELLSHHAEMGESGEPAPELEVIRGQFEGSATSLMTFHQDGESRVGRDGEQIPGDAELSLNVPTEARDRLAGGLEMRAELRQRRVSDSDNPQATHQAADQLLSDAETASTAARTSPVPPSDSVNSPDGVGGLPRQQEADVTAVDKAHQREIETVSSSHEHSSHEHGRQTSSGRTATALGQNAVENRQTEFKGEPNLPWQMTPTRSRGQAAMQGAEADAQQAVRQSDAVARVRQRDIPGENEREPVKSTLNVELANEPEVPASPVAAGAQQLVNRTARQVTQIVGLAGLPADRLQRPFDTADRLEQLLFNLKPDRTGPHSEHESVVRQFAGESLAVNELSAYADLAADAGAFSSTLMAMTDVAVHSPEQVAGVTQRLVPAERVIERLVSETLQRAEQLSAPGSQRFHLRLDPPELGQMEVEIERGTDGRLSVRITAFNEQTHALLERSSGQMTQTFAEQEMSLAQFDLSQHRSPDHERTREPRFVSRDDQSGNEQRRDVRDDAEPAGGVNFRA